jgi:hypothetical protein
MVVPPKKFHRLLNSQMAHMGYIVGQSNNLSVQTNIVQHNDLISSIMQKPILHVPSFLKVWKRGWVPQMLQEIGRWQWHCHIDEMIAQKQCHFLGVFQHSKIVWLAQQSVGFIPFIQGVLNLEPEPS